MRKRANYGVDRPDLIVGSMVVGALLVLVGSISRVTVLTYVGAAFFVVIGTLAVASPLKPRTAEAIIDSLRWRGDEMVLDVGCGRGLWLITAAKHLTTGRAVGVDIWNKRLQSGNSPEKTLENARLEGVADKVEVKDGMAQNLPFGNQEFDVVLSSLVVHHVPGPEQHKALEEMARVLKPGGQLAMHEVLGQVKRYAEVFLEIGLVDVRTSRSKYLFFLGFGTITARKP